MDLISIFGGVFHNLSKFSSLVLLSANKLSSLVFWKNINFSLGKSFNSHLILVCWSFTLSISSETRTQDQRGTRSIRRRKRTLIKMAISKLSLLHEQQQHEQQQHHHEIRRTGCGVQHPIFTANLQHLNSNILSSTSDKNRPAEFLVENYKWVIEYIILNKIE